MVSENDFLMSDKTGKLIYQGNPLTSEQKSSIISQAQVLHSMDLYKLLMNEMKYVANKKIFFDAKNIDDMMAGKMVLWTLDVIEKKIENLAKL